MKRFIRKVRRFFRSAITGKFFTREYAEAHPETTVEERIS